MISGVRASSTRIRDSSLVHDAEIEIARTMFSKPVLHVVAQIVRAETRLLVP